MREVHGETQVSKASVLAITILSSFITPFMASSMNIALPSIGREFRMDAILLGWVATSYLLAAAMFLVPMGRLADMIGRRKIFFWGTALFGASSLFAALSSSTWPFLVFRVAQGIGGAMIFSTSTAILVSVFPLSERGKVIGITTAAVYTGLSIGPFLGGFMTQHLGWRSLFFLSIPVCIVILVLIFLTLKAEWAEEEKRRFDWQGSLIYGLSLVLLMYGLSRLPAVRSVLLTAGGVVGILCFILWETKTPSPVLNLNLFRKNTAFGFSNLAALINYSATSAVTFLLSLYLQYIKGFDPQTAGAILVAQPVVMASFSPIFGRLSDRVEPRQVASAGMTLTVVGLLALTFLRMGTALTLIIAVLILLGMGFALFSSPNMNAIMSSVEKQHYGIASASLATMRMVGQMLSMGLVMMVFSLVIGPVQITPGLYPLFLKSARVSFIVFALLCFAGIFASLARGELRPNKTS